MLKLYTVIRKMSNASKLRADLAKKGPKKRHIDAIPELRDIEDTVKSPYFSPVQTRQQRKVTKTATQQSIVAKTNKQPSKSTVLEEQQLYDDKEDLKPSLSVELPKREPTVATDKWEPKGWRQMLANIRQMRATAAAPVDTMGCHKCSDDAADEKTQRYQKLVALMLSSQTKDDVTYEAMQRLRNAALTPKNMLAMDTAKLEELLRPVSFYKNKAKYLQQTAKILIDKYDGDIPNNIKELVALPGVGPKMAHLCMATAWNEVTGIGVDVHVHRITNRLQWLPKPTKEPEQTRVALESWLPRDVWRDVNHLLVGFGQTVCTAVRPHCAECLNRHICPAAPKALKQEGNVKVEDDTLVAIKKAKLQKKKLHL